MKKLIAVLHIGACKCKHIFLEFCDVFCEWQAQNSYIETLCMVGILKEGALYEAQMVQDDTGWSRGLELFKMVPCGTRWCQVVPGIAR